MLTMRASTPGLDRLPHETCSNRRRHPHRCPGHPTPGQKPRAAAHLFPPGQKVSSLEGQRSHDQGARNSDLCPNRKPSMSQNSITRQPRAASGCSFCEAGAGFGSSGPGQRYRRVGSGCASPWCVILLPRSDLPGDLFFLQGDTGKPVLRSHPCSDPPPNTGPSQTPTPAPGMLCPMFYQRPFTHPTCVCVKDKPSKSLPSAPGLDRLATSQHHASSLGLKPQL